MIRFQHSIETALKQQYGAQNIMKNNMTGVEIISNSDVRTFQNCKMKRFERLTGVMHTPSHL